MTINYKIEENDFLTHQLFLASKSDRVRKKRFRNKVVVTIIYLFMGLVSFISGNIDSAKGSVIIALLWFFLYPLWEKRHYIRHYKSFLRENYEERFGKKVSIEFINDFILIKDNASEGKLLTTEVQEIHEIPSAIYIRLKGGQSIILPKQEIDEIENLKDRLNELASFLKIEYNLDEKWEWK
ncbi:MAG: hypothetical protein PHV20_08300 [Bacteroidales bacterium]|nr:hypothetical protein [Bacteroidales bacterium]